ncbi:MAG: IS21-like element helper ATPase IstB [Thiohalocapsa sp.]
MAFAKLSGALLARKDGRAAPTLAELVSVPTTARGAAASPSAAQSPSTHSPTTQSPAAPSPRPRPAAQAGHVSSAEDEQRLAERLKALKLQAFITEHDRLARECEAEGLDHSQYLLRLAELELSERKRRTIERRIKAARFPAVKSLDEFDFAAIPSLNKELVLQLASGDYIARRENIVILGNGGTGKTHIALGLGLAACRQELSVGFVNASLLAHQLLDIRDEWRMLRLQQRLAAYKVLIIDELGYAPLAGAGAGLVFETVSQRHERGSTIITSNLPFEKWADIFGTAELANAVVERLTHRVHMIEMHGERYRHGRADRGR